MTRYLLIFGLCCSLRSRRGAADEAAADRITLRDGSVVLGLVISAPSAARGGRVPGAAGLGRAERQGLTWRSGIAPSPRRAAAAIEQRQDAAGELASGAGAIAGRRPGRPHPAVDRRRAAAAGRPGGRRPDRAGHRAAAADRDPRARPATAPRPSGCSAWRGLGGVREPESMKPGPSWTDALEARAALRCRRSTRRARRRPSPLDRLLPPIARTGCDLAGAAAPRPRSRSIPGSGSSDTRTW